MEHVEEKKYYMNLATKTVKQGKEWKKEFKKWIDCGDAKEEWEAWQKEWGLFFGESFEDWLESAGWEAWYSDLLFEVEQNEDGEWEEA